MKVTRKVFETGDENVLDTIFHLESLNYIQMMHIQEALLKYASALRADIADREFDKVEDQVYLTHTLHTVLEMFQTIADTEGLHGMYTNASLATPNTNTTGARR